MVPISAPGKPLPLRDIVMYWPTAGTITISPGFSPARLITAPWPAKMPRVGKTTAVVNPALRANSIRRSEVWISSAAFSQLVVAGRSSGPREGGGAGVFVVAAVAVPRPPRPAAAAAGAAPGKPHVLRPST